MNRPARAISLILCVLLCLSCTFGLSGCEKGAKGGYEKNTSLDTSKDVVLCIASGNETWPEMDSVITRFEKIYPNCTVICEYLEDYTNSIDVRLSQDEQKIDILKTLNIQESTAYKDKVLNLISDESKEILDLSGTNEGIVKNFRYLGAENTQYAIPYGGEMRGLYVNTTLLKKYGLETPTNRAEFLNCCKVLYEEGYVPIQSDVGSFAQQLLYPYICNSIVNGGNYEADYAALENIEPGISEYFRDVYTFLYDLVEKGYYDYKRCEEDYEYTFEDRTAKARGFFNVIAVGEDTYEKQDDLGFIAFMPDTQAFALELEKTKSDYHSTIEYEYILSPVGEDGGCAYLSPADGLAINKNSDNREWALEFLNFFFTPEINKIFAEESGKIPNTSDALLAFDVPEDHISDVGQMTFSYSFYRCVTTPMLAGYEDMVGISKMNAKKYMKDNGDGSYSLMYTVDEYLERLESEFQLIKAAQ